MASGFMNYTDTAVTKESDLLGPGDILGLTRGVPKTRWNVALSQRVGRVVSLPVWSKYSNAQRVSSLHVYHHHEKNHPGKENLLLFPASNLSLP